MLLSQKTRYESYECHQNLSSGSRRRTQHVQRLTPRIVVWRPHHGCDLCHLCRLQLPAITASLPRPHCKLWHAMRYSLACSALLCQGLLQATVASIWAVHSQLRNAVASAHSDLALLHQRLLQVTAAMLQHDPSRNVKRGICHVRLAREPQQLFQDSRAVTDFDCQLFLFVSSSTGQSVPATVCGVYLPSLDQRCHGLRAPSWTSARGIGCVR